MKEEERLFYEDVKEKAITARSAHKRPSHSGRARFPYRTAKELRALNGPTYTVNLGKPIAWDDFRALPENLQRDYVTNLIDKYDAGPTEIARIFGVNMKTCSSHLRRLGFKFAKGHKQSQEKREELRAAYGVAVAQAPTKKTTLENISFCFCGPFNAESFIQQLTAFIPADEPLRVSVVVEVVRPEPSAT